MVSITFKFPQNIYRNRTVNKTLHNLGAFVRDLWLARSPYAGGKYADGLRRNGSIKIGNGFLTIENNCPHAEWIEKGFRSFNIGLRMLFNGKGVKYSKEGYRYKIIHVEPKPRASFRKPSVANSIKQSARAVMPLGMRGVKSSYYGDVKEYSPRKSLQKNIKPQKPKKNAMNGFFVISEKAIMQDSSKWKMPDRKGKFIAKKVMNEAKSICERALRVALKTEQGRQKDKSGKNPKWYKNAHRFMKGR